MSGLEFKRLLTELGYKSQSQGPSHLDWIFTTNDQVKLLLAWLINNISATNVLSIDELQGYSELLAQNKVLDGKALKEAISSMKAFEEDESVDTIRQEIESLKTEIEPHQQKLRKLVAQRDMFAFQQSSAIQKNAYLKNVKHKLEEDVWNARQRVGTKNEEMDRAIQQASKVASDIVKIHQHGDETDVPFLFSLPLQNYNQLDDAFTKELNRFIQKQLQQKGTLSIGEDNNSNYTTLGLSDPSSLLIRGHSAAAHAQACKELARLQTTYAESETQLLAARMELERNKAALKEAKSQVFNVSDLGDFTALRQNIEQLKEQIKAIGQRINTHISVTLPNLYIDVAQLHSNSILLSDYNLKIARQCYHITKQDRVLWYLLSQIIRHKILSFFYTKERHTQNSTAELVTSLAKDFEDIGIAQGRRLGYISSLSTFGSRVYPKKQNDMFLLGSHEILLSAPASNVISLDTISRYAAHMFVQIETLQQKLTEHSEQKDNQLKQLLLNIKKLNSILYASPTTMQPILSPQPLTHIHHMLENVLQKLTSNMDTLIRERTSKLEKMQYHPEETQVKRNLFAWFLTNSDKTKVVDIMRKRVEARQVELRLQ